MKPENEVNSRAEQSQSTKRWRPECLTLRSQSQFPGELLSYVSAFTLFKPVGAGSSETIIRILTDEIFTQQHTYTQLGTSPPHMRRLTTSAVPNILVLGTGFVEDNFSMDWGSERVDFGMIQTRYISCAFYFCYCYISSTSGHQALDPRGWGLLNYVTT